MSNRDSQSLFVKQLWYAGAISERRCEEILSQTGRCGAFLVRDCIFPGTYCNYILSVYSGREIVHYEVNVFQSEECEFNGYSFTSLPDAITFYTENRLNGVYLCLPEKPIVTEIIPRGSAPIIMVSQPAPPPRSTLLQVVSEQQEQQRPTVVPLSTSPLPPYVSLGTNNRCCSDEWGSESSGDVKSNESYFSLFTATGSPDSTQDVPSCIPDSVSTGPSDNESPESKGTSLSLKQNVPHESKMIQINTTTSTDISSSSEHNHVKKQIQQGRMVTNDPLRDVSTSGPTTEKPLLNKKQEQVEFVPGERGQTQLHSNLLRTTSVTHSKTLERCSPKPPSTSPPSLPGSIDRRSWQHHSARSYNFEQLRPGSRPRSRPGSGRGGTIDRMLLPTQSITLESRTKSGVNRHGSFSGSRQGTLERRTPPPLPTSQPPPIPTTTVEELREHNIQQPPLVTGRSSNTNIGQMAGKMELVDLIPGVPRHVLTDNPISKSSSQQHENGANGPINIRRKERRSTLKKGHRKQ